MKNILKLKPSETEIQKKCEQVRAKLREQGIEFILAQFIFNNVNQINHTKFNLNYFPFKSIDYLTTKHQIHHIDMHHGNYSTLSPLYDWMFGTLD